MNAKIIFLVTEDWYFLSHRLPVARAARDAGFEVVVATRVTSGAEAVKREGFRLIALNAFKREKTSPLHLLSEVREIARLYRREKPDIVHHVAIKPTVLGALAARIAGVRGVVSAITGLGFVFGSSRLSARLLRPLMIAGLRMGLRHGRIITQNQDDANTLIELGLAKPGQMAVIRGSGVDPVHFQPLPDPGVPFTVALVARMLWDKGVREVVGAVRVLRAQGATVRVLLAGSPDPANPNSVPVRQLEQWHRDGEVVYLGRVDDVREVWRQAHVAILPSYYREGLPKSLLEAAACGRPMIATDAPGCREIVLDGHTGIIVPVKDVAALSGAISRLMTAVDLRIEMGKAARALVEAELSEEKVAAATLAVYRQVLQETGLQQ